MMYKFKKTKIIVLIVLLGTIYSCREIVIPKPKGYFRIDLPKKQYKEFVQSSAKSTNMPFTFEYPAYGKLSFQEENVNQPGWFNIEFPAFKAKIYFTYKDVKNDFNGLMEQTYTMNVKNHITKADAIDEQVISNNTGKSLWHSVRS